MRTLIIALIIFFNCTEGFGQYKYAYYLDVHLNSVPKENAVILGRGAKEEDGLLKLDCFDRLSGQLLMSFHFTDSALSELQGEFISYNLKGFVEKKGYYNKGIESGDWSEWDSLGRITRISRWKVGILDSETKSIYNDKATSSISETTTDFGKKIIMTTLNKENGEKEYEIYQYYGLNDMATVIRFEKGKEVESFTQKAKSLLPQFPGGDMKWGEYLKTNLNANIPVENNAPDGIYQVVISFAIDEEGNPVDIKAETKYGFGMEAEGMRIIKTSPKWIPASIGNKKIKKEIRQPMTFSKTGN